MIRRTRSKRTSGSFEAINITPFTDVLLVLLIIFMIAGSSMVPTALAVNDLTAPGSGIDGTVSLGRLTVWLGVDGQTVVEKDGVRLDTVGVEAVPRSTPVTLRVASETSAELAIGEYERWRERGFSRLSWGPPGLWSSSGEI